jgi:ATP-dependent RNA helicase RhlE
MAIPPERRIVTEFSSLGLAEPLLRVLTSEGYVTPTPIQARAIPPLMEGRDLLGIAQTGTGKTAAFALPILQRLHLDRRPPAARTTRALVLAPTRELAAQIAQSFRTYGRFIGVNVGCVVGGASMGPQIQQLARGLDVLVATPGRLLDHLSNRHVRLDATDIFVLDEADHMLDLGFILPIRDIVRRLPKRRQNLFFSATMPKEIAGLAADILKDPVEVQVAPVATTVERVAQEVFLIDTADKRHLLVELLERPDFRRTIVFTRTKRGADRVTEHLESAGIRASAIHGNKSQGQRSRALEGFKAGGVSVLVATDIAARGIDVDGVTHVVNFELPDVPEVYVHRIGRTARAGADGSAVSLCGNEERGLLRGIERLTRQTLPVVDRRKDPGASDRSGAAERSGPPRRGARPAARPAQRQDQPRGRQDGPRDGQRARPPQRSAAAPAGDAGAFRQGRRKQRKRFPAREENRVG